MLTALFDVLDGTVARRSNRSSTFGAFLRFDARPRRRRRRAWRPRRVLRDQPGSPQRADGGRLPRWDSIGAYLTSYIRARAEALGIDAKVGMVQRPERIVLLSVPQAFFGLAFNGLGAWR